MTTTPAEGEMEPFTEDDVRIGRVVLERRLDDGLASELRRLLETERWRNVAGAVGRMIRFGIEVGLGRRPQNHVSAAVDALHDAFQAAAYTAPLPPNERAHVDQLAASLRDLVQREDS